MTLTSSDFEGQWTVDTGSDVNVIARMFGFLRVVSRLKVSAGSIQIGDSLSVNVETDPNSVVTDISKRDKDLRKSDFLDVDTYSSITFEASQPWSGTPTAVPGTLSIKGKHLPVTLNVTDIKVADDGTTATATATATAHLDRNDVGLNKSPSFVINPRLDIEVNLRARRA